MADSTEKKAAGRDTQWGRWQIVREVQFPPTTFRRKRKDGSLVIAVRNNAPAKAVLLDLAQWDDEDRVVYKGVKNIAAATGLSPRAVNDAMRVLHDLHILRREQRGMGMSKRSILDWDVIKKLRKPFREQEEEQSSVEPVTQDDEEAAVAALISGLPHVGEKLTPKDAESIARSLLKRGEEDEVYVATRRLSEMVLTSAANADQNPAGYLLSCIDTEINNVREQTSRIVAGIKDGSIPVIEVLKPNTLKFTQYVVGLLKRLSGGDFTFGAIRDDGERWIADVILTGAAA